MTSSADVLEQLGLEAPQAKTPSLGPEASAILTVLAKQPAGADELSRATGLGAAAIATALAELELAGAVVEADGLFRGVMPPQ